MVHIGHTEATNRTADGLPERKEQADSRERFLTTAERARILLAVVLLRQVLVVGLYLKTRERRQNQHGGEYIAPSDPASP